MPKLHTHSKQSIRRVLLVAICLVFSTVVLGWGVGRIQGAPGAVRNWFGFARQAINPKNPTGGPTGGKTGKSLIANYDIRVNGNGELDKVLTGKVSVKQGAASQGAAVRAQIAEQVQAHALSVKQGLAKLRETVPSAEIKISPQLAAVEMVRSANGLTPPYDGQAIDIVRSFLRANKALYGLTDADIDTMHSFGESVSRESGLRMVRLEQMVNGRPIFQSETRFTLARDGRLIRSVGLFVPRKGAAPSLANLIPAQDALVKAMASVGVTIVASDMRTIKTTANGAETEVVPNNQQITGNVVSRLVYFPAAPGVLIPAWSQVTFTNTGQDWYTLVDATTGALLWRKNIRDNASAHEARFRVYVQPDGKTPADSPAPMSPSTAVPGALTQAPAISPTIVNMSAVQNLLASPNGWIDDCPAGGCTANETQTIGNNVHAYMDAQAGGNNDTPDTNAAFVLDGNGKPMGNPDANGRNRDFLGTTPRDFQTGFLPPPQAGNPEAGQNATGNGSSGTNAFDQFRRGMLTQLFYTTNWYHDRLFALGFDEAAGNFQQTNFSGMGVGGDRVLAEGQDNSGTNNANFSTPPDGMSGRAQMFRFTGPTLDRDGSLDSEVLIHELTHGLSNRLIGNGGGLAWSPGGGMGEGWSDFYALSLLNNTNADDPNARYTSGAYATYKLGGDLAYDNYVYGIRRFPYSTDNTVNPLTWADTDDTTANYSGGIPINGFGFEFNGAFEVHNIGEVWAVTLWEVRSRIIAANGGDVPTGNNIMLRIVTDAMKMTPINPTFTEARDALIDADCATNACANEASIWGGFADRGLGYNALSPLAINGQFNIGHQGLTESFQNPYLDLGATTINDTFGNNNGIIDPGEAIKITVNLKNPWRVASKNVASATATLTALTAGVTVTDANSTYGAIPAQGTTAGDTFTFTVPTNATCGQLLKFTVQTNSALGNSTLNLAFRVGQATGTGAPVTLTRTVPAGGLNIPDNDSRGVVDTFTISQDMEIADLNFRVDSLTHPFTGDVTVMLKGPDGYGSDLIWLRGVLFGAGAGDNFTNTVIDDQATNDLNQSPDSAAPFTDSWLPAFNSPVWNLFGDPTIFPDSVGQLSYYNGKSTQGDWKVLVADSFQVDTGKLNSWSLIVTPKTFSCAAFTPMVAVTGTKTVSGTFNPGNPITYTVTLTNNGALTQPDNAGNEFSDVLPPQLTLVSANASSGTAATAANTVTWNGSIPAAGGSVTITINAIINGNASGTVSNQGTISFDTTADGSNESTAVTDDPGTIAANDPTTFTLTCPTITLSALSGGAAGTAYSQTIVASPAAAYTYTQTAGTLPPGLTLAPNGALTGTPTTVGAFTFTVTASLGACTGERTYTLVITCPVVTLAPDSFPNAEVGTVYNQTVTASPAGGNYTYAVTSGFLPTGLSLNATNGVISGTPSQTGNFNFRVTATGFGSCSTFRDYQINVTGCALIAVMPVKLDDGTVGTAYGQTVSALPAGAYTFSVSSGSLPLGLSLDPATGVISGTPTAGGSYSFRVKATLDGCFGVRDYTVVIGCPTITLTPLSLLAGQAGVAYSQTISVSPAGSYTFSLSTGSLPSGLTLNATTGLISGTPSSSGTATFTIKAQVASGCFGTQSYTLVTGCPTVTLAPASLPNGTTSTAYSQTLSASPAGGNYSFAVTAGSLPLGLNLNPSTGLLSGTPTANGSSTFTVTATGFGGCTGSQAYTIVIGGGGCSTITLPGSLPNGSVGALYSNSAAASPADAYNYTVSAGALPPGLTLFGSFGLIFGYPTSPGTYNFTITATLGSCTGSQSYSVVIGSGVMPAVLQEATVGKRYTQHFNPLGLASGVNFSVASGKLPEGITLTATGALSGTPSEKGKFLFTLRAADAVNTGLNQVVLNVTAASTPVVSGSIVDPLNCTRSGSAVNVSATVLNDSGAAQTATFTAALPAQLLALPGSCSTNVAGFNCSVTNASTVTATGTLANNQSVTITYQAQIADGVPAGAQVCLTSTASFAGAGSASVQACATLNCPTIGVGSQYPAASLMSDQKAGSVLIYNIYTSATDPTRQNTRLSITNTDPARSISLHLFFVDGSSCSVADSYLCLTANQTASFLASDLDPGTSGYVVAIATDANGCPTNFNFLIGDEYVKFSSGHAANLAAEAIAALPGGLVACNTNSTTATLAFDGISYNQVPRVLAVDNVGSRADGNDTLLILNRIGGNLATGASTLGTVFGILYDDSESGLSFSVTGSCQLRNSLSNTFPRTTPRFENFIPAGRSGWLKVFSQSDIGLSGSVINFNPNAGTTAGAFNQGHNLHILTGTAAMSYTIPVFPPGC